MNDPLATTTPSRFSRFFRRDVAALDAMRQNLLQEKAALAQQALELKSKMDLGRIHDLSPSQLVPNPDQPRKVFSDTSLLSLSESIMQYGIYSRSPSVRSILQQNFMIHPHILP